jgi:hypothetical protein
MLNEKGVSEKEQIILWKEQRKKRSKRRRRRRRRNATHRLGFM